jgi:hypothetical protein
MLKPSSDSIALLASLVASPRPHRTVRRLFPRTTEKSEGPAPADDADLNAALDALGRTGDWRSLPYLTWLLLHEQTWAAVSRTIRVLLPDNVEALARLDAGMRETAYAPPTSGPAGEPLPWASPDLQVASAIMKTLGADIAVAGLLSFSPRGHVREAAVRALESIEGGGALPFLLLRVNDWVEPVARYATRCCATRLRFGNEEHFVRCLPLVYRLREQRRWDHLAFVDLVERYLSDTEIGRRAVLGDFDRADRTSRRARADLVCRCFPVGEPVDVPRVMPLLDDPDSVVRSRGIAALARLGSHGDVDYAVRRLSHDSAADIRRRVFALAEARIPAMADALATELVFDRNAWLREFGRQRLLTRGPIDFAKLYRDAIGSCRHLEAALLGLMETGVREDASTVHPHVDAQSARVRRAALMAATALDPPHAGELLLRALASPCTGLSRLAGTLMVTRRVFVPSDEVEALLSHVDPTIRRRALRVLQARHRWASLVGALRLRRDADSRVAQTAGQVLQRWKHLPTSLYVEPSAAHRAELVAHLEDMGDIADVQKTIRTLLNVAAPVPSGSRA